MVSVIIPCYNRAATLANAIDSVLKQTFSDFELIVVDDCSTDESEHIVKSYNDPRLRFLKHETNKGAGAARNTGWKNATAEFVTFLDSDDVWYENYLESQVTSFLAQDSEICAQICRFKLNNMGKQSIEPQLEPSVLRDKVNTLRSILMNNFFTPQIVIIRKHVLVETGGFDESLKSIEDLDLGITLSQKYRFSLNDTILVEQFLSPDSLSYKYDRNVKSLIQILDKQKLKDTFPRDAQYSFNIAILYYALNYTEKLEKTALLNALSIYPYGPRLLKFMLIWALTKLGLRKNKHKLN